MNREVHVRFRERLRGKFPRATRPPWRELNTLLWLWVFSGQGVVVYWIAGRGSE